MKKSSNRAAGHQARDILGKAMCCNIERRDTKELSK